MDVRTENRGRPHQKSAFSCGLGGGEKLFDPWASGRKGQECPREIRTKKFMFMLLFLSEINSKALNSLNSLKSRPPNLYINTLGCVGELFFTLAVPACNVSLAVKERVRGASLS